MPWCEVEPDRLRFLSMFGYDILSENSKEMLARYDDKVIIIRREKPFLYFEDVSEALQLGVKGIIVGP